MHLILLIYFNLLSEKSIVLNMIKMAACGEFQELTSRPNTASTQARYVWAPKKSHTHKNKKANIYSDIPQDKNPPSYPLNQGGYYEDKQPGGLTGEPIEDAPFKLPENDTIIRTAHQLSRLASRNSSRAAGATGLTGLEKEGDINKLLAQKLSEKKQNSKRQRSATLPLPTKQGKGVWQKDGVQRSRSRSVSRDRLPPIPNKGKSSITKETIGEGSGSARLRYTSHWES